MEYLTDFPFALGLILSFCLVFALVRMTRDWKPLSIIGLWAVITVLIATIILVVEVRVGTYYSQSYRYLYVTLLVVPMLIAIPIAILLGLRLCFIQVGTSIAVLLLGFLIPAFYVFMIIRGPLPNVDTNCLPRMLAILIPGLAGTYIAISRQKRVLILICALDLCWTMLMHIL